MVVDNFLANEDQSFLTLLGDFGMGKSSFSMYYFIIQAKRYLLDKSHRIPLFISLKDYSGKLNIETFIINEFYNKFELPVSLVTYQDLALQGKFLFFIDGFDEMASMSNQQETIKNFKELTKLSCENLQFMTLAEENRQANKVFMTCRTHYFFTETQEQNILRADKTILYRNYATKRHYQVARINLKKLNQEQIGEYALKSLGNEEAATQLLNIIKDTYNLEELSSRPLLLDMIIKTVPELKDKKQINAADLYREYTNLWIERDDWRSQMTSQGKRTFMWELALKMYQKGGDFSLHYSNLDKPKKDFLKQTFDNEDYYQYETTTCSFLHRNFSGHYKFIHKSFMEYFIAEYFCSGMAKGNINFLENPKKEINNEIIFFIKMIILVALSNKDYVDLSNLALYEIYFKEKGNAMKKIIEWTNSEKVNLEGVNFEGANFVGFNLVGFNLVGLNLKKADLGWANLKGANLEKANFEEANLRWADLEGANLEKANLSWAKLKGANFKDVNLKNADLIRANCEAANFLGANFLGANFFNTKLEDAKFDKEVNIKINCNKSKLY